MNNKLSLPPNFSFSENDWHVLASFWHPIVFSHDVMDKPIERILLDQRLVLYLTDKGISIAKNLCPHHGTTLSLGWMEDNQIVCPYHGLHYDRTGKCTLIPAAGPDAKIPESLKLETYPVVERYGIIWTCLKPEEAKFPIPEWDAMENSSLQKYKNGDCMECFSIKTC